MHPNTNPMTETQLITNRILLECPKRFPCRVWRRNVGGGYGVDTVQAAKTRLRLGDIQGAMRYLNSRPITFGQPGEADIDGIVSVNGYGVRLAIEVKGPGDRLRPDQERFLDMVRLHGGLAIVAHDVDLALADLGRRVAEASR